jgi:hypothetical protein
MTFLTPRSLLRAGLAVPATTLALLAAAGTPASAATAQAGHGHAAAPQAALTWHALKLANGWKSASTAKLNTGKPAWAIRDGVVYLRGAVTDTVTGTSLFSQLPVGARPSRNLYIEVYTSNDTTGDLFIGSDGEMEAYYGEATTFTSLATVSFPAAAVAAHRLTLKNGWQSSQSTYQTGNPSYAVSHGVVYLSGSLHGGKSKLAFVLPRAARPAHLMNISVYTMVGSIGWLTIRSTGQVRIGGGGSAGYTSLATISFPVASTKWHPFKLIADWRSGASRFRTGAPSYAVVNGVVYLAGSMYQSAAGTIGLWTDVPAAAQPRHVLEIKAYMLNGAVGAVAMTTFGLVSSHPFSNAQAYTSLAGISYPPSS